MDERLDRAVRNNVSWCDRVCRAGGVPTEMRPSLWVALRRSPPLYPDAVTLTPAATAADVVAAAVPGPGCSIKDSFGVLDLEPHGFEVLFEGHWIHRSPEAPPLAPAPGWTVVESGAALAEWLRAAGDDVFASARSRALT